MKNYLVTQAAVLVNSVFLSGTTTPTTSPAGGGTMNVNNLGPVEALKNLATLLMTIVSIIGIIIIVKNIMELGPAIQQQDSGTINNAIKGIVGGAIMAGCGITLAFLGFKI